MPSSGTAADLDLDDVPLPEQSLPLQVFPWPEQPTVVRQSKRDSRALLRDTLWPEFMAARGKKGRIDKILSKEDFLPNRGKKFLLRRLSSWLRNEPVPAVSLSYPKRGKKTKSLPSSRPSADLMWLTKDEFFPHRGKKSDNKAPFTSPVIVIGTDFDDIGAAEAADYAGDVPAGAAVAAAEEGDDGVIFGDRDWRPTGLLNNLSKQEPRDKWRGRKRSVQTDTDHYDNVQLSRQSLVTAALNEVISFDIYGR